LEANGKPTGGKWIFDADNRIKFPKKEIVPAIQFSEVSSHMAEARIYVLQHFPEILEVQKPHIFL
jgi:deoxyribodipyrimidine photolyase-related protein